VFNAPCFKIILEVKQLRYLDEYMNIHVAVYHTKDVCQA